MEYSQGQQYPAKAACLLRRRRADDALQARRGRLVDPQHVRQALPLGIAVEHGHQAEGLDTHEPAPAHQGQHLHHAAAAFVAPAHGCAGVARCLSSAATAVVDVAVVVGGRLG